MILINWSFAKHLDSNAPISAAPDDTNLHSPPCPRLNVVNFESVTEITLIKALSYMNPENNEERLQLNEFVTQ